jgi:hypothetical protein
VNRTRLTLAAATLSLAACHYSYGNLAQSLGAGEVAGLARSDGASAAGVSVSVKGSAFDQATRPTGRFALQPLAAGPYTVLLRSGRDRALLRQVPVPYGDDGRPEGVWLGALELPRAVNLGGTVAAPGDEATEGVAVDETTGLAVALSGSFLFEGFPVGAHRIFVATRDATGAQWVGGPTVITITEAEGGTAKEMTPFALHASASSTGLLTFAVVSSVEGLPAADAQVALFQADGTQLPLPAPDSTGRYTAELVQGIYFVQVRPPPAFAATVDPPARLTAVVVTEEVFDAGTLHLVEGAARDAAQQSCVADADCGPAGACAAQVCTGYAPPTVAPATVPFCSGLTACAGFYGTACSISGWQDGTLAGTCAVYPGDPFTFGACLPCGAACTTDGVTVLSTPACP